ncbi:MAG: S8 family serine peptidase [Gemmatimonadales bacterium]
MRTRSISLVALVLAAAGCADRAPDLAGPAAPERPLLSAAGDQDLTNRWIVVFRDDVANPDAVTTAIAQSAAATVHFRYGAALKGFAATIPQAAVEGIRRNPNVSLVEADGIATIYDIQASPPSWGLDRIDQRALPLSASYEYQNQGGGVRAYILDTGVRLDHVEYNGRAVSGRDFIDGDADASDCHGHGTHVAGTVGGTNVGVAKGVTLVAVRVLNCQGSGTWSQVIAGIDWVAANHVKPAVANMSLGGGASSSVNAAVANAVTAGVTFAVAAGNENVDACSRSPASTPSALTVGASTSTDARASFSNFGTCVDLFAPGSGITSSVMGGGYQSWSGTSMATPHVAGVAALWLAANPAGTPAQVASAINGGATSGVLSGIGTGSPNRLLYSLVADGSPPPPPPPPPPPTIVAHVADLAGSSALLNRKNWQGTVTISVVSASGAPVANATVSGSWSGGATGAVSCVTNAAGTCSVQSGSINVKKPSATLTVTGIGGSGIGYDPSANVEGSVVVTAP